MSAAGAAPIRSWIYVAADDADGVANAVHTGVDALILDLEDLVPVARKPSARMAVTEQLAAVAAAAWPRVFVRINHSSAGMLEADLDAAIRVGVAGIRYPKAEDPDDLRRLDESIGAMETSRGIAYGSIRIVANIESAIGVLRAGTILQATERIDHFGFGEADFSRDVGAHIGPDKRETFVARSLLVLASRAAGRTAPCDGAHLVSADLDGLRATTAASRDLGFFGRTAVAPDHVRIINEVFTPDDVQIRWAHAVIAAQSGAEAIGRGSAWLDDGTFVDIAVQRAAKDLLALVDILATRDQTGRVG